LTTLRTTTVRLTTTGAGWAQTIVGAHTWTGAAHTGAHTGAGAQGVAQGAGAHAAGAHADAHGLGEQLGAASHAGCESQGDAHADLQWRPNRPA
jgi:hypothetical protein